MKKPVLVIINSNYPNENNRYGDVFVHTRAKEYLNFFDVEIVGWKKGKKDHIYIYEGIKVNMVSGHDELFERVRSLKPSAIGIHFVEGWMTGFLKTFSIPVFIWVHGAEALGWYRRMYLVRSWSVQKFFRYMVSNTIQMFKMHLLFRYANRTRNINFIFVSNWMKRIAETDTVSQVKNAFIIPNPVNTEAFKGVEKSASARTNILVIRSFDNRKYATDQVVEVVKLLSTSSIFPNLVFSIHGDGRLFDEQRKSLENFSNVTFRQGFLENKDIPTLHADFGIFLCPTRQDAQGVSMCEAMSSGLVAVTSNNTAIPEFVTHGQSGFLGNSTLEMASYIEQLYNDPTLFLRMSRASRQAVVEKCSQSMVIQKEVQLIQQFL